MWMGQGSAGFLHFGRILRQRSTGQGSLRIAESRQILPQSSTPKSFFTHSLFFWRRAKRRPFFIESLPILRRTLRIKTPFPLIHPFSNSRRDFSSSAQCLSGKPPGKPLAGESAKFPNSVSMIQYFESGSFDRNKMALIGQGGRYTFKQLDEISDQLAVLLKEEILSQGKLEVRNKNPDGDIVVGVMMLPSEKMVCFLFAILKLGAAYVPLEVKFPQARIDRIMEIGRPILVISDSDSVSKFDQYKSNTVIQPMEKIWSKLDSVKGKKTEPFYCVGGKNSGVPLHERTCVILFTSGSTGLPKGVRINHRTVMNRLHWGWNELPISPGDVLCWKTTITFIDAVLEIFPPLLNGNPLVVFDKESATQTHLFPQLIEKEKVTRLTLVPSLLDALLSQLEILDKSDPKRKALDSIKIWICTSETLVPELIQKFFKCFPQGRTLYNLYGSTETMGDVTYELFRNTKDVEMKCIGGTGAEVPLGRTIYNNEVYLLDAKLQMVPEGEIGEMFIAGENLASGYVGIKESPSFLPNPFSKKPEYKLMYRTGDFASILTMKDGKRGIFYHGRVDSQVKVRGQRVDLSEIQAAVRKLKGVDKAFVICYHTGKPDQAIVSFVLPEKEAIAENPKAAAAKVDGKLKKVLLQYQRPYVQVISELPLLTNGKVDRQKLLTLYEEEMKKRSEFKNWDSLGLEGDLLTKMRVLVETIAKVTGTPIADIVEKRKESFYNLGGTSLNSIQVIAALKKLKYGISIPHFVSAKSIEELHQLLRIIHDHNDERRGSFDLGVGADANKDFQPEAMTKSMKEEAINIIATSFGTKGDLEGYVGVTQKHIHDCFTTNFDEFFRQGLSYVVRRKKDNRMVAVCMNLDAHDFGHFQYEGPIATILDFIGGAEHEVLKKLPQGLNKVLLTQMVGTADCVSDAENVYLVQYTEEENYRLAKRKGFIGIITTNTNLLTQQIAAEVMGHQIMSVIQINQYVDKNGKRPFAEAPDSQTIQIGYKPVKE